MRKTGDAHAQLFFENVDETFADFLERRLRNQVTHNFLTLSDDSVQTTIVTHFNDAAFRLLRVLINLGAPQRRTVGDCTVPTCAGKQDRVLRRCCIEIGTQRSPLFSHEVFRPAVAADPLAGAEFGNLVANEAFNFLDGCRLREIDISLWLAAKMRVRIDEAWHQDFASEIDRIVSHVFIQQLFTAHSNDAVAGNGNERRDRQTGINRDHLAVVQNGIDGNTGIFRSLLASGKRKQKCQ